MSDIEKKSIEVDVYESPAYDANATVTHRVEAAAVSAAYEAKSRLSEPASCILKLFISLTHF
jgi:hypothetical protein